MRFVFQEILVFVMVEMKYLKFWKIFLCIFDLFFLSSSSVVCYTKISEMMWFFITQKIFDLSVEINFVLFLGF